jgi:hypothetical protein
MRAFVRGLIDGDGCLCTHTNGTMSVGFTNHNESLLEIVAGYFFRITGAVPKILRYSKRNGSPVKMVTVSGPRAAAVACDLYLTPPARMALGRKCQKAKEIVAITNVKRYKKEKLPTPW